VLLEGCEGASNGSASNRKLAVTGRRAGCVDKVIEPVDDLTRFGSGDEANRDPLTSVASSRRGYAAITSGADQKAGSASHVGCVHGFGRCGHRVKAVAKAIAMLRRMIIPHESPKFIVHLEAATRRDRTKR
jgi:hypothetical protein